MRSELYVSDAVIALRGPLRGPSEAEPSSIEERNPGIALLEAIKTHRIYLLTIYIYVVTTNIGRSIKSHIIFVLLFCLSPPGLPLHTEVPSVQKLLP